MVEVNSAMKVIVCECQAGREGQMYLIWFTQTLEAGGWGMKSILGKLTGLKSGAFALV